MSVNDKANDINAYGSHTNKRDNGTTNKEDNVVWSCLMSCWAFLHHYFIRACCHLHICKKRIEDNSNDKDLELSTYPIEDPQEEEDSCISDDHMKKRLLRHFRSHVEKWIDKDRPRFPWKATLHILLVALVTGQVNYQHYLIKREVFSRGSPALQIGL